VTPPQVLNDLARRIDAAHCAVAEALQSALGHAIAAGEMLIQAKRHVKRGGGQWLPWLDANSAVPARTASHYMALAKRRGVLCDENGNVLPISVSEAVEVLKPQREVSGVALSEEEMEEANSTCRSWRKLPWGQEFGRGLAEMIRMLERNPPKARYVVKAACKGNTPGLTSSALREVIALLNRYADALECEGL